MTDTNKISIAKAKKFLATNKDRIAPSDQIEIHEQCDVIQNASQKLSQLKSLAQAKNVDEVIEDLRSKLEDYANRIEFLENPGVELSVHESNIQMLKGKLADTIGNVESTL